MIKYCGIDVGINGGIAFFSPSSYLKVYKVPTIKEKRKTYDIPKIIEIFEKEKPDIIIIEKIHSLPKDGHVGAFSFGMGLGIFSSLAYIFAKEVYFISPQKWKRKLNLSSDKSKSVELCNKIFKTNFTLKQHNEAEALLLIYYYMRYGKL